MAEEWRLVSLFGSTKRIKKERERKDKVRKRCERVRRILYLSGLDVAEIKNKRTNERKA